MRIVNPKDIFDWKNISKRILPKVFLKKLYKPALIIVGVQIILLPLVLNYNRSTIKYALGINSRYDLLSLYDKQYNYISDFLFYLKDIAAAFLKPNSIEFPTNMLLVIVRSLKFPVFNPDIYIIS